MADNFLTIESNKLATNFSNKWRNVVFVLLLVVVFGSLAVGYVSYAPPTTKQTWQRFSSVLSKDRLVSLAYGVGGDVEVVPAPKPPALPDLIGELPKGEQFSAASMFVKDRESGVVLYAKNGYEKRPLASITKLMTALVLLEHNLDSGKVEAVTADQLADSHVYSGEQYTVEQLWQAMLVASSNKAAATLADATHWTREAFVERMNQKAVELGMVDTIFVEPTGLDPHNISTGSDISILLNEAMKQEKIVDAMLKKEIIIQTADSHQDRHIWNTNWLLTGWVPHQFTLLGGKTGFIEASGYNLAVRLGHQDGRLLDIIILGANGHESRFTEARDVAEGVFGAYQWPE